VSGKRIPPNTPLDLAAGDTLRLGASRREYRLLWLSSLREAFEMEDPLPPLVEEDKEDARTCEVCPSTESSLIVLICAVDVDCVVNVQEESNKLVPGQKPPLVDIGIHEV
jgi:hypothetical protein